MPPSRSRRLHHAVGASRPSRHRPPCVVVVLASRERCAVLEPGVSLLCSAVVAGARTASFQINRGISHFPRLRCLVKASGKSHFASFSGENWQPNSALAPPWRHTRANRHGGKGRFPPDAHGSCARNTHSCCFSRPSVMASDATSAFQPICGSLRLFSMRSLRPGSRPASPCTHLVHTLEQHLPGGRLANGFSFVLQQSLQSNRSRSQPPYRIRKTPPTSG